MEFKKKRIIKENAYRVFGGLLATMTLAGSSGCAIEPAKETPAPSTPIESLDPTLVPTLTPIITSTPEPTPDLTFRTADDINNEDILRTQAQLISEKFKNSNVPYDPYFSNWSEEIIINYLKWCNARVPSEEISLEAAQLVLDDALNTILNDEIIIIWDILAEKRAPIKNANFVGYASLMPTNSYSFVLATKINEIKNELASFPSRERQIELAQESLNMSLDFMLSNDAVFNEENVKKYFMIENDERNIENSEIETYAFKMSLYFDFSILVNMAYIIEPSLKAQYPSWHEKYPEYMEINIYDEKYNDFFKFIYYQTTQNMVKECENYVKNAIPTLNPQK